MESVQKNTGRLFVMKKSKSGSTILCGVLLAGVLMLTGCGEEPWELTDNEQDIIVNYAAHIVAKYNVKQPEGYTYVYQSDEDEDETDAEPEADEAEVAEDETGEAAEPEDKDTADAQEDQEQEIQEQTDDSAEAVSLSEALGLVNVQAVYTGAQICDNYDSVVPEAGKELLILHVTLQNNTSEEQPCDLMSELPVFRAVVNGTVETTSELTILTENLATWETPIAAGASEDAIILFQVQAGQISEVEQLKLQVSAAGATNTVVFL
jgi:predicted  nucleic acid-binding Zn-ribbon protein